MDIDNITLEEVFELLLERLVDFSIIPTAEIHYLYADVDVDKYDKLILNSKLTKPTLAEFESELELYKEELRVEEQERIIADAAREANGLGRSGYATAGNDATTNTYLTGKITQLRAL